MKVKECMQCTYLSTCHHIPASHDNGYAVLLHWSRLLVSGLGYILHKDGSEACPSEGLDGAWNVVAGGGHWNVVILGKVDATGDARGVELSRVAVSLGHVHLLGLALLVGESVGALLIGAVLAHVALLATLAAAHWLWTVGNLMAFFPAPPALGWLWTVGSLVTFLSAVVALVWLGTVVPDMALSKQNGGTCQCNVEESDELTGFLHFLQSSGSGQSELLWPS